MDGGDPHYRRDDRPKPSAVQDTPAEVPVPHLQIALVPAPDQVVVRLSGDADASTAARLARALQEAAVVGRGAVVVDVAGTRFRDFSGLQVLSLFTDALSAAGRRCRIVGAPAATRRLIRSAGLADRLELDGPVDNGEPALSVTADPLTHPRAATSARRAVVLHQVRPARCAEERAPRRRMRLGALRRWH